MKNKFFVNPLKLVFSLFTSTFTIILAICQIIIHRPGSALVFTIIALLFIFISFAYGTIISINETGINSSLLGRTTKSITWDKIVEISVAGTQILNQANKNRTGTIYIIFSDTILSNDDFFNMILRWPPKNNIYLQYSKERLDLIQFYWSNKIRTYNIGKLIL